MKPAGLILAGGKATRMGGKSKALILLDGIPLARRVAERLAPQVARLAISANDEIDTISAFGFPVLRDTVPGHAGPLAGILAGLLWASSHGHAQMLVVPTDGPFVPRDLASQLTAGANDPSLVLAQGNSGPEPAFGLWPVSLATRLADWLLSPKPRSILAFATAHDARFCQIADDCFFNINSPDDLTEAEIRLARKHSV